jgi:hypothetical protein
MIKRLQIIEGNNEPQVYGIVINEKAEGTLRDRMAQAIINEIVCHSRDGIIFELEDDGVLFIGKEKLANSTIAIF